MTRPILSNTCVATAATKILYKGKFYDMGISPLLRFMLISSIVFNSVVDYFSRLHWLLEVFLLVALLVLEDHPCILLKFISKGLKKID
jgi:hypothetical protein